MVHSKLLVFYSYIVLFGSWTHFYTLVFFATHCSFELRYIQKNLQILKSRNLELFCSAKMAEGIEASFHFKITIYVWHRTSVVTSEHRNLKYTMLFGIQYLIQRWILLCSWLAGPLTKSCFFSAEAIAFFNSFLDM